MIKKFSILKIDFDDVRLKKFKVNPYHGAFVDVIDQLPKPKTNID